MNSHKLIMLPIDTKEIPLGSLVLYYNELGNPSSLYISNILGKGVDIIRNKPQHLYIISSEKIKEGENRWTIESDNKTYLKSGGRTTIFNCIIATTDKSLNLPLISESDVKHIIDYYNKNGKLPDIDYNSNGAVTFKWHIDTSAENPVKYPYRVGRKQGRAVLDSDSHEVVLFPAGREKEAQEYCDWINNKEKLKQFLYSEITERRDYSASKMCEVILTKLENL